MFSRGDGIGVDRDGPYEGEFVFWTSPVVDSRDARTDRAITSPASARVDSVLSACRILPQGAWSAPSTIKVSANVIPAGKDAMK